MEDVAVVEAPTATFVPVEEEDSALPSPREDGELEEEDPTEDLLAREDLELSPPAVGEEEDRTLP